MATYGIKTFSTQTFEIPEIEEISRDKFLAEFYRTQNEESYDSFTEFYHNGKQMHYEDFMLDLSGKPFGLFGEEIEFESRVDGQDKARLNGWLVLSYIKYNGTHKFRFKPNRPSSQIGLTVGL